VQVLCARGAAGNQDAGLLRHGAVSGRCCGCYFRVILSCSKRVCTQLVSLVWGVVVQVYAIFWCGESSLLCCV
jgi:hypothetical protein